MDEKFSAVGYEAASGNLIFNERHGEKYQESVLYHSIGPSTTRRVTNTEVDADIYDDPTAHLLDPVYEDPNLIQVAMLFMLSLINNCST